MPPRPPSRESAAPSPLARILAFTAIVVAGACGGLIGFALVDLLCDGDCTVLAGLAGVLSALAAAVGVAVVAVLTLRAMGEWKATPSRPDPDG